LLVFHHRRPANESADVSSETCNSAQKKTVCVVDGVLTVHCSMFTSQRCGLAFARDVSIHRRGCRAAISKDSLVCRRSDFQ